MKKVFLHDYYGKVAYYRQHFRSIPAKILSTDHTFKTWYVRCTLKMDKIINVMVRSISPSALLKTNLHGSKHNHPQFRALLILMNEEGMVVNFCLTRGESLKEAKENLEQEKDQSPDLELIITGESR
jgi:hypothetical protein